MQFLEHPVYLKGRGGGETGTFGAVGFKQHGKKNECLAVKGVSPRGEGVPVWGRGPLVAKAAAAPGSPQPFGPAGRAKKSKKPPKRGQKEQKEPRLPGSAPRAGAAGIAPPPAGGRRRTRRAADWEAGAGREGERGCRELCWRTQPSSVSERQKQRARRAAPVCGGRRSGRERRR